MNQCKVCHCEKGKGWCSDCYKPGDPPHPRLPKIELVVTDDVFWQPESKVQLSDAIARIESKLPGWWWTTGSCHVSAHASIGPDRIGPDAALLNHRLFDSGFDADLSQPATCGDALLACLKQALAAKQKHSHRAG